MRQEPIKVLWMLSDGEEHGVEQIVKKLELKPERALEIIEFFSEYGLAEFDKMRKVAKISPPMLELMRKG